MPYAEWDVVGVSIASTAAGGIAIKRYQKMLLNRDCTTNCGGVEGVRCVALVNGLHMTGGRTSRCCEF